MPKFRMLFATVLTIVAALSAQAVQDAAIILPKKDRKDAFQEKRKEREGATWRGWRTYRDEGSKRTFRREGQLIVRYKTGSQASAQGARGKRPAANHDRWLANRLELIRFDESAGFDRTRESLLANPEVEGVEPNIRFHKHDNGPDLMDGRENQSKQEYLARYRRHRLRHGLLRSRTPAVDATSQAVNRGRSIHVAILDTGIDGGHPDLAAALGDGFNAIYVPPSSLPVPVEDMDSTAMDYNGHGTMVAGVIGARNSGSGVDGLDDQAVLHAVKVLDKDGIGDLAGVLAGMRWAIDHRVDIMNMSFGSYEASPALEAVIREASEAGILLVGAAGNDFADDAVYPGRYPQVICVGSIEEDNTVSRFSNWGADVDLYAPGFQLYTTRAQGGGEAFGSFTGTSASAAYVTGILALLGERGLTGEKAAAAVRSTALRVSSASNPRDIRLPLINEDALFGEVSNLSEAALSMTRFDLKALPASLDGSLSIGFRVQNGGRARISKPALSIELTCGAWSRIVGLPALPALAPRQEHSGSLELPLRGLVPPEWADTEARIIDYRVVSSQGLERGAKGSFDLYPPRTPKLNIRSVWISPMRFQESRHDRIVYMRVANCGNAPFRSLFAEPTIWEGAHESVWRSPRRIVGPDASIGALAPGEERLVAMKVPDLDSLPFEFTLDLELQEGSNPLGNYLQTHAYSPTGAYIAQYAQVVHRALALEAIELLRKQGIYIPELHDAASPFKDGQVYKEWGALPGAAKYTTDYWTDSWMATNLPSTLKYTLVNGAHDCDGIDVSSQKSGASTWDTHFWIVDNDDNDGGSSSPSAYNKIQNLMKGGQTGGLLKYGALAHYKEGHKKAAWWFLGHAVHLIGDLSLGSHVNEENAHGVIKAGVGTGDVYHGWMDAGNYSSVNWQTAFNKGGYLDPYGVVGEGNPLRFLSYSMAQVGNSFPWAHTGDGTDQGKGGNRVLAGWAPHYDSYLSPVIASLNKRPLERWHINKNEILDACPGFCCDCADECDRVDVVGSDETLADCWDRDGVKDQDNTDGPPSAAPSNADGDIARIRDDAYPYSIRAAAGLIYYFALESGQLGYRAVWPLNPILL